MARTRVIGTTASALQAEEAALGRRLPPSFANWLLENNGLSLNDLTIFPVYDARDPRKTWNSLARNYREGWRQWRDNFAEDGVDFPNLLPFAEFGTGDYYCFDYDRVGSTGEPVVVQWSHETGETVWLAEDFDRFREYGLQP